VTLKDTITMKKLPPFSLSLLSIALLSGCSSLTAISEKNDAATRDTRARYQDLLKRQSTPPASENTSSLPAVAIKPLSKPQQAALEKKWLTDIQGITLDPAKNAAVPATAIIRMLRARGLNIVSHLPLDMYSYNGFGVTNVNAETALMVFLGAMGLDYELDNARQLVVIQPLKSRTWQLNIGNRQTSFSAGDSENSATSTGGIGSTQTSQGIGAGAYGAAGTFGASNSGSMPGAVGSTMPQSMLSTSNTNAAGSGNGNNITTYDDVWSRLRTELNERLTVPFPKTSTDAAGSPSPNQVPGLSGAPNTGTMGIGTPQTPSFYNMLRVGTVSINPETGAVTVQAPRYLMDTLDKYMKGVIKRYNTLITFEAELVSITGTEDISKGLDWAAFNTINNGSYTSIAQNNILGGAVISPAAGTTSIADALSIGSATVPGANALFGVASTSKKFAAINAYLGSIGHLKIKDTPVISTTSGSPVKLNNTTVRYYQQYQQTAASGGTGSAAVATNVIDIPYETGITIRINPTYNVETDVINCLFSIDRRTLQGYQDKINPISTGNSVQLIPTKTPIIAKTNQNGSLVLRNGAFVVVGGLVEDVEENSQSGIPGLMDTPLKALTGKETKNQVKTTYYFALRVTAHDPTDTTPAEFPPALAAASQGAAQPVSAGEAVDTPRQDKQ